MFAKLGNDRTWTPSGEGVERSILRAESGGRTSLVRIAAGARIGQHGHIGKEEVYVVKGRVRIGADQLQAGDYQYTAPGEEHDLEAFEDSMIYVITERVLPGR